jgi:hypothetical protein
LEVPQPNSVRAAVANSNGAMLGVVVLDTFATSAEVAEAAMRAALRRGAEAVAERGAEMSTAAGEAAAQANISRLWGAVQAGMVPNNNRSQVELSSG